MSWKLTTRSKEAAAGGGWKQPVWDRNPEPVAQTKPPSIGLIEDDPTKWQTIPRFGRGSIWGKGTAV